MRISFLGVAGLGLLTAAAGAAAAPQDSKEERRAYAGGRLEPRAFRAAAFGMSAPVRSITPGPALAADPDKEYRFFHPVPWGPHPKPPLRPVVEGAPRSADGAVQRSAPEGAMPSTLVAFPGLNNSHNGAAFGGFVSPPDTVGDVGPGHYVQAVNLLFRVFDKTGTPLSPPLKMSSLFASLGGANPCALFDDGDPIVLYDELADRWLLSQFAITATPPFHQCIAISRTGDPLGSYFVYDFEMPRDKFNDYPHFGVWSDGYYMTVHQFNAAFNAYQGQGVFAFDRVKMVLGDPGATYVYFDLSDFDLSIGGMLPADVDGPAPPPGTPNYFAHFLATEFGDPSDALKVFAFHADFADPFSSTFAEAATLPVASFDPRSPSGRADIEQPVVASTRYVDSIQDRLMFRLQYRNFGTHESLVGTHTVNVGPSAGGAPLPVVNNHQSAPRYFELRRPLPGGSWAVNEQATFAPDTHNRWMGSAAMDSSGHLAVGYSVSSLTVSPSIRYAGRLATDPPNSLAQGEAEMFTGSAQQNSTGARWGDYSSMSVDPADGCTFWYTQEYYATPAPPSCSSTVCWQTGIGSFRFPECTSVVPGSVSGVVTNAVSAAPIAGAVVQAPGGYMAVTDPAGAYSFPGLVPGSYTFTVTALGYVSQTETVVATGGGAATQDYALDPTAALVVQSAVLADSAQGNGNGILDPSECAQLTVTLRNDGALGLTGIVAQLSSATPGVTAGNATAYPDLAANGGTGANTITLVVSTASGFVAGLPVTLTLEVTAVQGTFIVPFTIPSGTTGTPQAFTFTGPLPIPDNNPAGIDVAIPVSGVAGPIAKVTASVRITHTFDGDLILSLLSPDGQEVVLSSLHGDGGDNFGIACPADVGGTTFDDAAPTTLGGGVPPYAGSFRPDEPLSAFAGKSGAAVNGTWTLRVKDVGPADLGTIECVTLSIQPLTGSPAANACARASVSPPSALEGASLPFDVTLDTPVASSVTVQFATGGGSATAGTDYASSAGTLTFTPGNTLETTNVATVDDAVDEPNETVGLNLLSSDVILAASSVFGVILDGDGGLSSGLPAELTHGAVVQGDLAAQPGPSPDADWYRIRQQPYSSYELVADATSADVAPLSLDRLDAGSAVIGSGSAVGTGAAVSLRWENATAAAVDTEMIRVESGGCGTACGPDDVYRLRAYETTYAVPRFNNAGSQVTVLVLQNPAAYTVSGSVHFWDGAGVRLGGQTFSLAPNAALVLNTGTVSGVAGQSGTITVSHDGRYGDLSGKTVALEPSTGLSFDTPMLPRVRR